MRRQQVRLQLAVASKDFGAVETGVRLRVRVDSSDVLREVIGLRKSSAADRTCEVLKMCGGFMGKWANLSPQPNLTSILSKVRDRYIYISTLEHPT